MKSKSRIWEICFNASRPLDGCWEEHDRESQACEWNRTGDEWSYCLHFSFPFSQSMNCFIMIKDKTGINDTFTFSHQRETWLNLDESSCGSGFYTVFSTGGEALTGWYSGNMQCCCFRTTYHHREHTFCLIQCSHFEAFAARLWQDVSSTVYTAQCLMLSCQNWAQKDKCNFSLVSSRSVAALKSACNQDWAIWALFLTYFSLHFQTFSTLLWILTDLLAMISLLNKVSPGI